MPVNLCPKPSLRLVRSADFSSPTRAFGWEEGSSKMMSHVLLEEDSPLKPRTFRNHFEHFDPSHFAMTFRGDSYHLPPIAEAIEQLQRKAAVQLRQRTSA
jgi:hypothetical protein